MRRRLRHTRWIGGGSGAGKSTIARRLAKQYGRQVYSTDDMMADHVHRLGPDESRFMHQFINMSMDDRWLNRSPELMRDTFHWFRGEGFHLIIEDLLARSGEPCIVEGFRLLPDLLKPLLIDTSQAV
ncbi:MAG TPA: ATP-binding protein [Candidatus Stackebrandtia faecavium]|nr:ATP-binding protein [Candidatus Stackebrandtia faecavium]